MQKTPLHQQLQRLIGDRFRLESELFGGGMSRVFVAQEPALGRRVVVKVLPPELVSAVSLERFQREIAVTAQLQHPHILPLVTAGEGEGVMWYVAPYIEERSLRERLEGRDPLPLADALRYLSEVTEAVAFAHARGVVHRDIKPGNVLLQQGHALLSDFGVAHALQDATPSAGITGVETHAALTAYLPPDKPSAEGMDLWSLGVLAHELTTGRLPNVEGIRPAVRARGLGDASAERALERFLARAVAPAAADRFHSASEMAAALQELRTELQPRSRARLPWIAAAAGIVAVSLAIGDRLLAARRDEQPGARALAVVTTAEDSALARALWSAAREWEDLPVSSPSSAEEALRAAGVDERADAARLAARVRRETRGQVLVVRVTGTGATRALRGQLFGSNGGLIDEVGAVDYPAERPAIGAARQLLSLALRGSNEVPWTAAEGTRAQRLGAWRSYDEGQRRFRRGDLAGAESLYRQVVTEVPAHHWARARLGQTIVMSYDWIRDSPLRLAEGREQLETVLVDPSARVLVDTQLVAAWAGLASDERMIGCTRYRRLAEQRPDAWDAWYGLGRCLVEDDLVLTDGPARARFRSSYAEAATVLTRSLTLIGDGDPAVVMRTLQRALATRSTTIRVGFDAERRFFTARGDWEGDSIVHHPELESSRRDFDFRDRNQLPRENAARLEPLARRWVQKFPSSPEAHAMLGAVLEVRDVFLASATRGTSAFQEYGTAAQLSPLRTVRIERERDRVRVLLRAGEFGAARRLADSIVRAVANPDPVEVVFLLPVVALRGDTAEHARWSRVVANEPVRQLRDAQGMPLVLPAALAELHHRLRSRAVLGVCDDELREAPRRLPQLLRLHEPNAARAAELQDAILEELQRLAPFCLGFRTAPSTSGLDYLVRLQTLAATRSWAQLRRELEAIDQVRRRGRLGTVSLDYATGEAELWFALGDTARAVDRLEVMLDGLANAPPEMVVRDEQTGALLRALRYVTAWSGPIGAVSTQRRWEAARRALESGRTIAER